LRCALLDLAGQLVLLKRDALLIPPGRCEAEDEWLLPRTLRARQCLPTLAVTPRKQLVADTAMQVLAKLLRRLARQTPKHATRIIRELHLKRRVVNHRPIPQSVVRLDHVSGRRVTDLRLLGVVSSERDLRPRFPIPV